MAGRKKKSNPQRFVGLYHFELECPAYRHLSVYGRALLIEFRLLYNAHNNGKIIMSVRQAAKALNCCKDTASKALQELQDKGWIREQVKGFFSPTVKKATEWRITNQPIGFGVDIPETKEYLRWRPEDEK